MPPPPSSATSTAVLTDTQNAPLRRRRSSDPSTQHRGKNETKGKPKQKQKQGILETAAFLRWGFGDVAGAVKLHPFPCFFAVSLLFFMGVEYTLSMVPASAAPFDVGFVATAWLNRLLASSPPLNTLLAGLNTVFVAMQSAYILWTFLIEGRIRPGLAALYMFTCRGILGYSTQLPLPQDFLGSGADFPVGNVSFFLFFSGHVAGSVIASLDMRRVERKKMAQVFDLLNFLQTMRLLGTRGHYTIDLAVGVGAGVLFDFLAGIYDDNMKKSVMDGSLR
ncbi:hypothetical protein V2J09_005418 [Rumex salicifolius]